MFAILKNLAAQEVEIIGEGWSRCCRMASASCARPGQLSPGPDDIYISPRHPPLFVEDRRHGRGPIRGPKEGERYFALLKVNTINFEDPEKIRHKVHFDNLTPLYPNERFKMEIDNPTTKDMSPRVIDLVAPLARASGADLGAAPHR